MDEKKNTPPVENGAQQPAPAKKVIAPEVDIICLASHPPKHKTKEEIIYAKRIANRYLGVPALEKILSDKRKTLKKRALANRFRTPETPDEFYDRGQKYLTGARCAVPFQEKANYYQKAADMFAGAGDFNDAPQLAETYAALANSTLDEGYEAAYREAMRLKEQAMTEDGWFAAAKAFERIPGYEQADALAEECEAKLAKLRSAKRPLVLVILVLAVALVFGCVHVVQSDGFRYQSAKAAASIGMDSIAASLLNGLDGYQDSSELMAQIRYEQGVEKMADGNYSGAIKSFAKCDGYSDSQALSEECHFHLGETALAEGNYYDAQEQLLDAGSYPGSEELRYQAGLGDLQSATIGQKVIWGQSKYIVLDRKENSVLLLSAKLYGESLYRASLENASWENSDMRSALNSDYLEGKFSEAERALIQDTPTSQTTTDKIFLLSAEEYQTYQPVMGSKDALWWLRDQGSEPGTAAFVSCDGTLMEAGYPVNSTAIQGRAALWVRLP